MDTLPLFGTRTSESLTLSLPSFTELNSVRLLYLCYCYCYDSKRVWRRDSLSESENKNRLASPFLSFSPFLRIARSSTTSYTVNWLTAHTIAHFLHALFSHHFLPSLSPPTTPTTTRDHLAMSRPVGSYATTLTEGIADRAYQRLRRSRPWVQLPEHLVPAPGQSKWDAFPKARMDSARADIKHPRPTRIPRPSTDRAPAAATRSPSPDIWLELAASEARESTAAPPPPSTTLAQPEPIPRKSALRTANTSRSVEKKTVEWGSQLEATQIFFRTDPIGPPRQLTPAERAQEAFEEERAALWAKVKELEARLRQELTSTEKVEHHRRRFEASLRQRRDLQLGRLVLTWSHPLLAFDEH